MWLREGAHGLPRAQAGGGPCHGFPLGCDPSRLRGRPETSSQSVQWGPRHTAGLSRGEVMG